MSKRAKVIFTNGFLTSPSIETTDQDLEDRILRTLEKDGTPATLAARFVLVAAAAKIGASLHNIPEAPTFGGTLAMIQGEGFWPGAGKQAGVFLVDIEKFECSFWGGDGFVDTPEFTKAIPQVLDLGEDEDDEV